MQFLGQIRKDLYKISGKSSTYINIEKNGTFTLNNLEITRGLAGTIYFVVSNIKDFGINNSTYSNCISNFVETEIIEEVDQIIVMNYSNQTNKTIIKDYNQTLVVNLQLFKNKNFIRNKTFKLDLEIIHTSALFLNDNDYTPLKIDSPDQMFTTNEEGKISVKYFFIFILVFSRIFLIMEG